jgi:biotin/methionine sulfoxide reductase
VSFDGDPSPLLRNIPGSTDHRARIRRPAVRQGWLEKGPGQSMARGSESFVEVEWSEAIELAAGALQEVYRTAGPEAVYGGSYGWASAGRFHHAQSQLHRFLNLLGGYVFSVNSYSLGSSGVMMPHILGSRTNVFQYATNWRQVASHAELVVCFGGLPLKNTFVSPGGVSRHETRQHMEAAAANGATFVSFSPLRDDLDTVEAEWIPTRPGTDVAVMLGLAYVLVAEDLADRAFLDRYTSGYETFERYLLGEVDGVAKTPAWAEAQSGVPAHRIAELARQMARSRTLVTVGWSLQRQRHGEQPPWMGITLAAMLGELGLPGRGFGHGYGSMAEVGAGPLPVVLPPFPQGRNPVKRYIPVARVADMLLNPGQPFEYNGELLTYPDIRLVYWAGGNPFHHHQDLGRLRRALGRADTVIVHDPFWTPTARHADIVFPSTVSLEREDLGGSRNDPGLIAMHQAVAPPPDVRDDYSTFTALAKRLGVEPAFSEGRTPREWLVVMYDKWAADLRTVVGVSLPSFDEFWERGYVDVPTVDDITLLGDFRDDPEANPLMTPSGKVEIGSERIAGFGYDDCPGHPTWFGVERHAGEVYPLQLVANNPRSRLHSQLDMGEYSQSLKVAGREPARLHPADAARRGIADGDVILLRSDKGSCLAGAVLTDGILEGVVQLSTGAWYDPIDPADPDAMCVHGNPNVLTTDIGTSRLAQGCSGQLAWVEVERWVGETPPIRAFDPPVFVEQDVRSAALIPS